VDNIDELRTYTTVKHIGIELFDESPVMLLIGACQNGAAEPIAIINNWSQALLHLALAVTPLGRNL
jgi:hypothetical protein